MRKLCAITAVLLLMLSARYSLAQKAATDSLLNQLKSAKEDTNKVNLLRETGISIIYQNPPAAIPYFKKAIELAQQLKFYPGLERNYAAVSTAYAFNARYDSALTFIDTAIGYARKVGDVNRLALVYLNKADALENLKQLNEALKYCDTAMKFAEQSGNNDRLARIYNIISDIYEQQLQYDYSLNYVDKAAALYVKMNNLQMLGQSFFDRAILYRKTRQTQKAIESYNRAITLADSANDVHNLSAYYGELADFFVDEKRFKEAAPLADKALQYARQVGNKRQEAVLHGVFYNLYFAQNNIEKAIASGLASYAILKELKDLSREEQTAASLAGAYFRSGNLQEAYRFLTISRELNDSLLRQQFNVAMAEQQTVFDVEQKEKEIQLLSAEKQLQEQRLSRQRVIAIGSIILLLMAVLGIALLISRYRLRQRIKEMQLRSQIAADLHDEVGSSLSSIHMLSEMATTQHDNAQKEILVKVSSYTKETMDKMGDIVWMIKPAEQEGISLKDRMQRFLYEMCESRGIRCVLEDEALDTVKLSMQGRKGLYLIFKEAVNNAVKYSNASVVEVTIKISGRELTLAIKDNGNGFDAGTAKKGNGLDNMYARAKELKGNMSIESAVGKGTLVHFTMPV